MDVEEKLLAALKRQSELLAVIGLALLVICAYVLVRIPAYEAPAAWNMLPGLFDRELQTETQIDYSGLAFSYFQMSILWPFVIATLCMAFAAVHTRRKITLAALWTSESAISRVGIAAFDPIPFFAGANEPTKRSLIARTISWLPFITVLGHSLGGITFAILNQDSTEAHEQNVKAMVQFVVCVLVIAPCYRFRRPASYLLGDA